MKNLVLNPYEGIDWNTIGKYKANFHTHTTESDGSFFGAEVIKERYKQHNYDILAITDHDSPGYRPDRSPRVNGGVGYINTWPWAIFEGEESYMAFPGSLSRNETTGVVEPQSMLTIEGNEPSQVHHHASFDCDWTGGESYSVYDSLTEIQTRGGMSMLYHPGRYDWDITQYLVIYDYYPCDILFGLEVYNQGDRYPGDRTLWDTILRRLMPNRPVWAYSNDDMHTAAHLYGNYNTMLMANLTVNDLRNCWVKGSSFCSYEPGKSGGALAPSVNSIAVNEELGTITVLSSGTDTYEWIADGNVVGTDNTLEYSEHKDINAYVRCELTNSYGVTLTNPFGFELPEPQKEKEKEKTNRSIYPVLFPELKP